MNKQLPPIIYRLQVKLENNDQIKEFRIYENKTDKLV